MNSLTAICLSDGTILEDGFDICYQEFKKTFLSKDNRPLLGDKEIFIPLKQHNWIENKAECFWHASSMESKISFEVLPCTNDVAKILCDENCTRTDPRYSVFMSNGDLRYKCIYRGERTNLISDIINLYNSNDPRVKYWEYEHKQGNKIRKRIYLRYQSAGIDYVVVFENKSTKMVTFITAFPVFFKSDSIRYEKDYHNYINNDIK